MACAVLCSKMRVGESGSSVRFILDFHSKSLQAAYAALEVVESVDAGAAGESVDRWASSVADADAF